MPISNILLIQIPTSLFRFYVKKMCLLCQHISVNIVKCQVGVLIDLKTEKETLKFVIFFIKYIQFIALGP